MVYAGLKRFFFHYYYFCKLIIPPFPLPSLCRLSLRGGRHKPLHITTPRWNRIPPAWFSLINWPQTRTSASAAGIKTQQSTSGLTHNHQGIHTHLPQACLQNPQPYHQHLRGPEHPGETFTDSEEPNALRASCARRRALSVCATCVSDIRGEKDAHIALCYHFFPCLQAQNCFLFPLFFFFFHLRGLMDRGLGVWSHGYNSPELETKRAKRGREGENWEAETHRGHCCRRFIYVLFMWICARIRPRLKRVITTLKKWPNRRARSAKQKLSPQSQYLRGFNDCIFLFHLLMTSFTHTFSLKIYSHLQKFITYNSSQSTVANFSIKFDN